MRTIWILLLAMFLPLAAHAQSAADISAEVSDDKGFITRLLERNLSGQGRRISIDGFQGALSSRATFTQMTIADADGVWLTLENGAIQWNRSALLRGRVDIAELSAERISLPRLPGAGGAAAPKAETTEFALPELPVGVEIKEIRAGRVELGQPVIGVEAAISIDGSMSLAGGEGAAKLTIDRLDGPRGQFVLDAGYSNGTKVLRVNLGLDEAADGLLVNLVNLYDKPSVTAQISGEGEIKDFMADIRLATDGQQRVTGSVGANAGAGPDGSPGTNFRVQLGGDIATLLPPEDRAFFGTGTQLTAEGWRGDDGRLNLPVLKLATDALGIDGRLSLNAKNAPETAQLLITLGRDANASQVPVALPFAQDTTVESGRLELQYDSAEGQGWTLTGRVGQLDQGQVTIGALTLDGAGAVVLDNGALSNVSGRIGFGGQRMDFADRGLAEAIGTQLDGSAQFDFTPGNAVELSEVTVNGADYGLSGYFLVSGLSSGFLISADAEARYDDLARLSVIANRSIKGSANASVTGYYNVLTKGFDIDAEATGQNIALDQPQVDRLLAGQSRIRLAARRDQTGIELSRFDINAQRLTAQAQGYLNSLSSDVKATISMPSLQDADPNFSGALQAEANLTGAAGARRLSVSGEANDLKIGIAALDGALQGRTSLAIIAAEQDGGYQVETLQLSNPQLDAKAKGSFVTGALDATATFELPDLSALRSDWRGGFTARASLTERDGTRFLDLTGKGQDLSLGLANGNEALTGITDLVVKAEEKDGLITLRDLRLVNDQLNATARGTYGQGETDLTARLDIASLAPFGPDWGGSLNADAMLVQRQDGIRRLDLSGTARDLAIGQPQVDGAFRGETRLAVKAEEDKGTVTLRDVRISNPHLSATASGVYGKGVTDLTASAQIASLASFGPGWRGTMTLDGTFRESGDGARRLAVRGSGQDLSFGQAQVDGALAGETRLSVMAVERDGVFTIDQAQLENPRLSANATGTLGGGKTDISAQLNAADLRFLGNGIRGSLSADASLVEENGLRRITATGRANGLAIGQDRIDPILRGQTGFDVAATQSASGLSFQRLQVRNPQLRVDADGDTASGMNVSARLTDLGLVLRELPGALSVDGTIRESGQDFAVDLAVVAPGDTRLQISGSAARNFSDTNLDISGNTNASIANSFIRTRSIEGPVSVDVSVNGPPSLNAVSGRIQLSGGELADPGLGVRLQGLNVTADLRNGRILVDARSGVAAGGSLAVSGPVDLQAGNLDLTIVLDNLVARDPNLYETQLNGQLTMSGNMASGPLIAGTVNVGATEIRIPSTGLGGAKAIPDIQHVGAERPPVRGTRAKAGLEDYPSQASRDAGMAGPPSTPPANPPRLDLQINAPNQIFIRGRGVDAEMGGALRVTGTTRNVIPIGQLELIRGRVDLLGKRFDLAEGLVELQGSLVPVIRLVAETSQNGITTRVIIDGEARDPEITFESSPELPEEEVLSQLLFGRGLDNISPLQAAQLANAIAVLAGRGGEGIVGNLRNQFGLDDLDLQTDAEGNVQVRAGKYLSENLYTDVAVGNNGKSTINLNLDVTESLTARGSVDSEGQSTLGIYFERDY